MMGFKVKGHWIPRRKSMNQWNYDFRHDRYYYCVVLSIFSFRDFKHCEKYRSGIGWSNAAWLLGLAR